MSDDEVGVIFGCLPADWKPPTRRELVLRWLDIKVNCNWFAIAWRCHRKGHDWSTRMTCWCRQQTTCRYCGKYRGERRIESPLRACNFHRECRAKP